MKKLLFALLLSCSGLIPAIAQSKVPLEWQGTYEGLLLIYLSNGTRDTLAMRLEVKEKDDTSMAWEITYINRKGQQDQRKYVLRSINPAQGHYIIDELNGIHIDAMRSNTSLVCRFSVENNLLEMVYNFVAEGCTVELYTSNLEPSVSGAPGYPQVKSYKVTTQQKAFLERKK